MAYETKIDPEVIEELLAPGYSSIETGYTLLPSGVMYAKALLRMPNCKGKMVDFWFGYVHDTTSYRMWHPAHVYFKWDEKWKPGHYIGATHEGQESLGGIVKRVKIKFHDPSEIFDTSRFKEAHIGSVIFGVAHKETGEADGHFIHCTRDTEYGCEMRSRFWFNQAPEAIGQGILIHHLEEMGNLAEFLPGLYNRETKVK